MRCIHAIGEQLHRHPWSHLHNHTWFCTHLWFFRLQQGCGEDKSFDMDAIRPAVGGSEKAVAFRWTAEMYQWSQTRTDDDPLQMSFDALTDCPAASAYHDDNVSWARLEKWRWVRTQRVLDLRPSSSKALNMHAHTLIYIYIDK